MRLHIPPSFLLGLRIYTNFNTFFSSLANSLRLLWTDRSNTSALAATSCIPTAADFCKGDSTIFARVPMHPASAPLALVDQREVADQGSRDMLQPCAAPCLISSASCNRNPMAEGDEERALPLRRRQRGCRWPEGVLDRLRFWGFLKQREEGFPARAGDEQGERGREEKRGRERRRWGCQKGGDGEREKERAGRWVGGGRRLAGERDRERKESERDRRRVEVAGARRGRESGGEGEGEG